MWRKLKPSDITTFDLPYGRIILKQSKKFICLFYKLFGCFFSPGVFYVINNRVEVLFGSWSYKNLFQNFFFTFSQSIRFLSS